MIIWFPNILNKLIKIWKILLKLYAIRDQLTLAPHGRGIGDCEKSIGDDGGVCLVGPVEGMRSTRWYCAIAAGAC